MTAITINLKNNNSNFTGTNGICIYNQRYKSTELIPKSDSNENDKVIESLEKVINVQSGYKLAFKGVSTSDPFSNLETEKNVNALVMKNDQILVFRCIKRINGADYDSYYCYIKEHGDSSDTNAIKGNVWLVYIKDFKGFPIVFDLQDGIEPTFNTDINGTVNSCNTSNFILKANPTSGTYDYEGIELKNTSFNLGYDETTESTVTIIPVGVVTLVASP